jgi:hypothetical protein
MLFLPHVYGLGFPQKEFHLNPTVITYFGFFVAALIILWAAVELGRRFYKRKRIDARVISTWVPLQPSSIAETENANQDDDISPPRSQQNGHYSESKKL